MRNCLYRGSAAPLALLFTVVSMYFTTAYLKNSFSQSAMENTDIQSGKHFMLQKQD